MNIFFDFRGIYFLCSIHLEFNISKPQGSDYFVHKISEFLKMIIHQYFRGMHTDILGNTLRINTTILYSEVSMYKQTLTLMVIQDASKCCSFLLTISLFHYDVMVCLHEKEQTYIGLNSFPLAHFALHLNVIHFVLDYNQIFSLCLIELNMLYFL